MNRIIMLFLVLAVTGGCMNVDPDPIDEYSYMPNQRSTTQAPSWTYAPQNTLTPQKAVNNSASSATVMAPKPLSSRPSAARTESTVVKTAYTEPKGSSDSDTRKKARKEEPSAGARRELNALPKTQTDEAELPPVNLGMLRLTNSKRITFHYEIRDAASVGADGLEIWGTTDMHTWVKYDTQARSPSSLSAEVKGEGLYGFTMIARGKGETSKSQPPSSEPPQVWVAVDLTKPVVQVQSAELNEKARVPTLLIRWKATDRNLGPRPITLLYAEQPEGPWRPIAANLENSGRYEGSLPSSLSATVYVRVQAADLMGNLGMAQTMALHLPGPSPTSSVRASHPVVSIVSVDGE